MRANLTGVKFYIINNEDILNNPLLTCISLLKVCYFQTINKYICICISV